MEYTIKIDAFSGPLDLLLHLIREREMEIHDVRIAEICDRYLDYIRALEFLDVDVSSDFLVMAATLMLIKSKSLLPKEEEVDLEEELDPEDELIQQLLEYKQFKVASRDLGEMADFRSRVYPFTPPPVEGAEEEEVDLEEVDLWDLVQAFAGLLSETGLHRLPRLIHDEKPLKLYIAEVFECVRSRKSVTFRALFDGAAQRQTVVGRFIALLELVRRRRLRVAQSGSYDEIQIEILDDRDLSDDEVESMAHELEVQGVDPDGGDDLPGLDPSEEDLSPEAGVTDGNRPGIAVREEESESARRVS